MITDKEDIDNKLVGVEKRLQTALDETKILRQELAVGDYCFEVQLYSLWADYGEKSVTQLAGEARHDDLSGKDWEGAVNKAETRFKEINNRSDVQAEISLRIITRSGLTFPLLTHHSIIKFYEEVGKDI